MNVNVHSIHFDADIKLVTFIREKLSKLTQFHDNILSAEVFLRLEHDGENRENKVVDIRLAVPGREHFAKRQAKTFEEAATATVEALRSQVERTKERLRVAS
jgi:putative sigma-54 modulation protein